MYVSYEMLTISLVLKIQFSSVLYLVAYQHQLAQDYEFLLRILRKMHPSQVFFSFGNNQYWWVDYCVKTHLESPQSSFQN